MNKFGISMLSMLATLGIVGGAGAIALSTPAVKEKLNISFADNVLFGKQDRETVKVEIPDDNTGDPVIPPEESGDDDVFKQELAIRNLVMVNYQINDDESIIRIQEKDSGVELFELPRVVGCTFIGWTDNKDTGKLVGKVENGMTLYPVYISNERHIMFEYYTLTSEHTNHINTANVYFGDLLTNYVNASGSFTSYLLGFNESPDSKEMMTTFTNSQVLYPIVYVSEIKKVCSYNEWKEEYSIYQCGANAMNNVKINTFAGVEEMKVYKVNTLIDSSLDVDGIQFTLIGFSMSADSTSTISVSSMADGKSYYAVYRAVSNYNEWSLNDLKNGWDIVIHTSGSYKQTQCKYYEDLETYTHRYSADGVTFNFVGFSLAEDSSEIIETSLITEEYCVENGIRHLYCVYERSDTLELYSSAELYELVKYRRATYVHYLLDGAEETANHVYLLDAYENDVVVDGVIYNFYGWSESVGSIIILEDIGTNNYHLYAVYKNSETEEIVSLYSLI